jgi:hypothetical protein
VSDEPVEQVHIRIPNESFRSVFLEMIYRGDGPEPPATVIARGTGFFYRVDGTDFLVTARHNFTGWTPSGANHCRLAESDQPTYEWASGCHHRLEADTTSLRA